MDFNRQMLWIWRDVLFNTVIFFAFSSDVYTWIDSSGQSSQGIQLKASSRLLNVGIRKVSAKFGGGGRNVKERQSKL